MKLLKRWYREYPQLQKTRDDFLKLANDKILPLSRPRNQYIHALLENYDALDDSVLLKSIEPIKGFKFKIGEGRVPLKLLEETTTWISALNAALAHLSKEIFTETFPEPK